MASNNLLLFVEVLSRLLRAFRPRRRGRNRESRPNRKNRHNNAEILDILREDPNELPPEEVEDTLD